MRKFVKALNIGGLYLGTKGLFGSRANHPTFQKNGIMFFG